MAKAHPMRLDAGHYVESSISEATHIRLNIPGPTGLLTLPIITKGSRAGTGCWTWNADVDRPTLTF